VWTKEHLVPPVLAMLRNPHYLYRMTVLGAIAALSSYVSADVLRGTMLPAVIECAKDKVGRAGCWGLWLWLFGAAARGVGRVGGAHHALVTISSSIKLPTTRFPT